MSTTTLLAHDLSYLNPGGDGPLFEGVDLLLDAGRHAALTGPNGSGKTTLLRILAGEVAPATGDVGRPPRLVYVRQEDAIRTSGTVREALLDGLPGVGELAGRIRRHEERGLPDPLAYADAVAEFERAGGYEAERRLESAADRWGLGGAALDRPAGDLSGGQRRLLRLLAAFLLPSDLVLLDEPTNHLDDRASESLAETVEASQAAVLAVSHDRWFMDRIASRTFVLERGRLGRYRGNYSQARAAREADRLERERDRERLEREIGHLREAERTYKVWGVRKEKEKSGAFDKGFIGARAARLMKRGILAKERIVRRREELEERRPWVDKRYRLHGPDASPPSGTCLTVRELTLAYPGGPPVLEGVHRTLEWGERVAVVGANGAGKSTFLRALAHGPAEGGGRVAWSRGARPGYLPQSDVGEPEEPVASSFRAEEADEARRLLGTLGIPGDAFDGPMGALSLGGRRKARLVRLLMDAPNVLLLDEPTTHLDLPAIEMLEEALGPYRGTLLLVSHDRHLREALTTREWRVGDGAVRD